MILWYSLWLITESINAWDIKVSVLFNLLLDNITILIVFIFYFLLYSIIFFMIPVVNENIRLKIAFAIPAGAPVILVKEIIDIPPLVADKTIKI